MTDELARDLEAILFVADEPVPSAVLAQLTGTERRDVEATLEALAERRAASGIVLRAVAGGWRLYTHPDASPVVERFVLSSRHVRLTRAALETLAVVAYLGPVSRPEIARIRGVAADSAVAGLVERGLVAEAAREAEGGAVRYETTRLFEQIFGLTGRAELPELDDVGADPHAIRARLEAVAERRGA